MTPYDHQQKVIDLNPPMYLLAHGTGSGKTFTALSLARGKTLVVAPKTQVEDENWQRQLSKMGKELDLTVISKERFRIDYPNVPDCDTLIGEECHTLLGVTPSTRYRNKVEIPKTSQLFEKLLDYVNKRSPKRIYLVSATPAPQPMAVWGIAQLFGYDWDYWKFRRAFYHEVKKNYHSIWIPRKDDKTNNKLIWLIRKLGDVVSLQECFDVPEQTFKTIYVPPTSKQKSLFKELKTEFPDPLVYRTKAYGVANGINIGVGVEHLHTRVDKLVKKVDYVPDNKIEQIKLLTDEFPKVLIFAQFIGQIKKIEESLLKEKKRVFTLTGATKDRGRLILDADDPRLNRAVFIAQAGISAGYELKTFRTVIWASLSGKYIDYVQGQGRVLRADNLQKNLYINLVTKGTVDEDAYKTIMSKNDFQLKLAG